MGDGVGDAVAQVLQLRVAAGIDEGQDHHRLELRLAIHPLDRRDQAIATLRDRLNEARLLGAVVKSAAQSGDGPRQHVFSDKGVAPDSSQQAVLRHHVVRALCQPHQHLHRLRFQARADAILRDTV